MDASDPAVGEASATPAAPGAISKRYEAGRGGGGVAGRAGGRGGGGGAGAARRRGGGGGGGWAGRGGGGGVGAGLTASRWWQGSVCGPRVRLAGGLGRGA